MSELRRIAVIGSNSFSGSDFVDHLLNLGEHEVLGISRSPEKSSLYLPYLSRDREAFLFRQLDLNRDMDGVMATLDDFAPDAVVNFAALCEVGLSWKYPWHWFNTNTVAVSRLVHGLAQRDYLKRYVHISSPEVYGTCTGTVTEDAPHNPSTPYAVSKSAADMLISAYVRNLGFPAVFIRSTNVYGAHQQLFKIIPRTVIYLKLGKKIPLHGGGAAVKSFIHIRDISKGETLAMNRGQPGDIFHFSPARGYSIRDIVAMVCAMMGRDFASSVDMVEERLGQDAAYVIDSSKARERLHWQPAISLEEGIRQVADWVESEWDAISREPLDYVHQE
jgi:dTDP-glucose 4,6-dehydratase